MKTLRIGNGAGFWGDQLDAPRLLAEQGRLDYLTLEYLAELTLSILAHQKSKDPGAGYVTDFPLVVRSLLGVLQSQPDLRVVTNAGGMNPAACAGAIANIVTAAGMADMSLATVAGDDLLPDLDEHLRAGETFANLDTSEPLAERRSQVASANAYLGARGIVDALDAGARIVITGRVADASLTVGPAVHEFGWGWNEWDRLAAASVAGHLIECGAQVTGGLFSNWTVDTPLANVGYPIAEIDEVGDVVIAKPGGTGGKVTCETVAEQLVYEIGDPAHYLTPDVDVDFTQVRLTQLEADRIGVAGARGRPAPARFKVSLAFHDGYAASGTLVVYGRDSERKARACAEIIFARLRRAGFEFARSNVEVLGSGAAVPGIAGRDRDMTILPASTGSDDRPSEVVLRVSVQHASRDAVERFTRELAPLVTSGPPGVTGYTGPRPKPHPVLAFWPTTICRSRVLAAVTVKPAQEWL